MDIQKLSNEIATLKRAVKDAATAPLKEKLRKKIALLDQNIKDANIPAKKLAMMLLGAKRKVAAYTQAEFNAVIKRLSNKDEYYFLKGLTKAEVKDDLERHAKNPGWRFKGRGNFKTPTKKDLINDMGKPINKRKTYFEKRSNRSDVTNPAKLKDGGLLDYKAEKFLDTIRVSDRSIQLKDITVDATPNGNWRVYHKGKSLMTVNSNLLNEETIDKYDLRDNKFGTGGGVGEEGYKSKKELNEDYKRIIKAPKSLNFYESLENNLIGKTVKINLPKGYNFDIKEDTSFKTKVTAEYPNMIKGSGKYNKLYDKKFIVNIYQEGGGIEAENKEMVLNNAQQIEHHAEELENAAKNSKHVPAWVVAKIYNASSNISDATHYLEGVNTMPKEHFERIHEEVESHKVETGGGIDSFLGKQMHISKVCKTHGCSTKDYFNAKNKYIQIGNLNDLLKKKIKGGGIGDSCEIFDSKGERAIDKDSVEKLTKCLTALPQTKSDNVNVNGTYTQGRQELHKKIINKFKKDVVCITKGRPIAVLMGGSPASGKSTFLKKYRPYLLSESLFKVDADEIRAEIPEYKGWNATQTHEEAGDIVNTLISDKNIGVPCNFDFIFDGTMSSVKRYNILIHNLRKENYQIYIVFMSNISKEEVKRRALERYKHSGRFVPMFVIDEFFANGEKNLNELKSMVDGYIVVDASSPNYSIIEQGGKKLPNKRLYEKLGEKIKLKKGGRVGDDQLNIVFSRQDVFERAKDFYENESAFYPSDVNDEFRTFVFDIENGEADVTEYYMEQELQDTDLDGYYFEIADKMIRGGGVKIMPQQGTLLTKDKKLKLDYKKNGNNFEFVVYEGETNPVANYTKTSFKKKENGIVTMDYNQFINYIYAEGYIDDKNYNLGGGVDKKKKTDLQAKKVGKVMHEFKEGTLHSGKNGNIVKNPKQAIAIALNEAGLTKSKGWKHKK